MTDMREEQIAEVARALWAEGYSSESDFIQAVIDKFQAARTGGEVATPWYAVITESGNVIGLWQGAYGMANFAAENHHDEPCKIITLYPAPLATVPDGWQKLVAMAEEQAASGDTFTTPEWAIEVLRLTATPQPVGDYCLDDIVSALNSSVQSNERVNIGEFLSCLAAQPPEGER